MFVETGTPGKRLESVIGKHKNKGSKKLMTGMPFLEEEDNTKDQCVTRAYENQDVDPVEGEVHVVT